MHTSFFFVVFLLSLSQSNGQINKFSVLNSRLNPRLNSQYQVSLQPSTPNQQPFSSVQLPSGRTVNSPISNIFNDQVRIMYRPQTPVVFNDGQEKEGDCPVTRPATGYSTFKQYEGIWFKRYRSRVRTGEPFFKCAYIDYIEQGRNQVFIMDHLQNNVTGEWARQNATSEVWANDPSVWTSTMPNGAKFDTHLIFYDGNQGVAVIYSCMKSANGHRGIGNIYTRSPSTPLSKQYVDFLLDIFHQNGIYDVLPLHFVDQTVCANQNLPAPRSGPPLRGG